MITVAAISQLKASLSKYLEHVKAGEEVVITERGKPIARVLPFPVVDPELEPLFATGAIRAPMRTGPLPDSFWEDMIAVPEGLALKYLDEDRDEGQY